MIKSPKEFADQMLELYGGNHDNAIQELFNAARAYDKVPCSFFKDVLFIILADRSKQ